MKFTKMIILMTLVALIASRSLEDDSSAEQTIGWGRQRAAQAEELVAEHEKIAGGDNLILEMSEEEQHLGLGF